MAMSFDSSHSTSNKASPGANDPLIQNENKASRLEEDREMIIQIDPLPAPAAAPVVVTNTDSNVAGKTEEDERPEDISSTADEDDAVSLSLDNDAREHINYRTLFFNDGVRRIDYVLVYRHDGDMRRRVKREFYQRQLQLEGAELETSATGRTSDERVFFLKVHVPFLTLCKYAETLRVKMPIKRNHYAGQTSSSSMIKNVVQAVLAPIDVDRNVIEEERQCFTTVFSMARMDIFDIPETRDEFFSTAERSRIAHEILSRCRYDPDIPEKIGIGRLLRNDTFEAAYPLHEGPFRKPSSARKVSRVDNARMQLYDQWARLACWFRIQPHDKIRSYYGEKIEFYFAWLGFYTTMLVPAAVLGILCIIYGVVTLEDNPPTLDICRHMSNLTMCPQCTEKCDYWELHTSCLFSRISYLFDNTSTVVFAVFMSFWATFYLEMWKRHQVRLAWEYDVEDFEKHAEQARPEFEVSVKSKRFNPVTQAYEAYLPRWNRMIRWTTSGATVLFLVCVVLATVFGVIVYRMTIVAEFYAADADGFFSQNAKLITSITAALINLVIILLLERLYANVALWLTEMENPRTPSEFEDSIVVKNFVFQFVNHFAGLFYIAFFKGRVPEGPLYERNMFGHRAEECDPSGCLIELCIQLVVIFCGKQLLNNATEIFWPVVTKWWRRRFTFGRHVARIADITTLSSPSAAVAAPQAAEVIQQQAAAVRSQQQNTQCVRFTKTSSRNKKSREALITPDMQSKRSEKVEVEMATVSKKPSSTNTTTVPNSVVNGNINDTEVCRGSDDDSVGAEKMPVDENEPKPGEPKTEQELIDRLENEPESNAVASEQNPVKNVMARPGRPRWEQDYVLAEYPSLGLADEYLEIAIQYGFVTLFVAAFPLAPLFAVINNIIEIRLDAYKLVTTWRRPLASRASDIGAWHSIFETLTKLAVVTNAFVIAFTTDFIPRMVWRFYYSENDSLDGYMQWSLSQYNVNEPAIADLERPHWDPNATVCYYRDFRNGPTQGDDQYKHSLAYWHVLAARLAFVLCFEHLVLFTTKCIAFIIPDVPNDLKTEMEREELAAKEALLDMEAEVVVNRYDLIDLAKKNQRGNLHHHHVPHVNQVDKHSKKKSSESSVSYSTAHELSASSQTVSEHDERNHSKRKNKSGHANNHEGQLNANENVRHHVEVVHQRQSSGKNRDSSILATGSKKSKVEHHHSSAGSDGRRSRAPRWGATTSALV